MIMKKIFTKFSLLFIGLMLCTNAWATQEAIGETGLYWEVTSDWLDETLDITGSGALPDYESFSETPWSLYIDGVKTLNLPSGLTRIGNNAFNSYFIQIASITIPANVTSIGVNAFNGCPYLSNITIERTASVVTLDNANAFPEDIEHIYVPADLVEDYKAAANWSDLASKISEPTPESPYMGEQFVVGGVNYEITHYQDYGYAKLVYAKVIPYTMNYSGTDYSMYYGDIVIPLGVTYAGEQISIVAIGDEAFKNSSSLMSVTIPSNIYTIGTDVFANCPALNSVIIPASVTSTSFYTGAGISASLLSLAAGDATLVDGADAVGVMGAILKAGTARNITINRPAQMENYNTICLPFALDADQIEASSLAGAEIYKFSNAAKDDDYLDLHFQPVTTMEAGVPYFFRFPTSGDNLSSLTFEDVTISNTTPQDVTHNGVTLHGTLSQVSVSGSNKLYLAANDELHYSSSERNINPFRAYFEVAGGMSLAPKARIVAHENAATGIEDVAAESKAVKFVENGQILIKRGEAVYNLQGQVVK